MGNQIGSGSRGEPVEEKPLQIDLPIYPQLISFAEYDMTPEERQLYYKCIRNGILFRSLPLFAASAWVGRWLIQQGLLQYHAKLGPYPKIFAVGLIGGAFGFATYGDRMKKKYMEELPDSSLAQFFRLEKQQGGLGMGMPIFPPLDVATRFPRTTFYGVFGEQNEEEKFR